MAKNRSSLVKQPPPAESSEEYGENNKEEEEEKEESVSEEEDDEDQSDDDQSISTNKPDVVSQLKPTKKSQSDTESESGSEIESNDDKVPRAKQPPKPVASKVTEKSPLKKAPNAAATTNSLKRNAEVERDSKDSAKRAKKSDNGEKEAESGGVEESWGKKLFQRLWSEEDEIIILEGIIDFVAKRGNSPHSDTDSFYDFIKKSIHIDVSKAQLLEKMRRLKRKYKNNSKRGKQGGERTRFSKAHEQSTYDLSKKVWGTDGVVNLLEQAKQNGGTAKKTNQRGAGKSLAFLKGEELAFTLPVEEDNGKVKVVDSEMKPEYVVVSDGVVRVVSDGVVGICDRMVEMHKSVSGAKIDEHFIKEGLQLLESVKTAEFENWKKMWKNLQLEELELHRKRAELVSEHSKFILDAYKSKQ